MASVALIALALLADILINTSRATVLASCALGAILLTLAVSRFLRKGGTWKRLSLSAFIGVESAVCIAAGLFFLHYQPFGLPNSSGGDQPVFTHCSVTITYSPAARTFTASADLLLDPTESFGVFKQFEPQPVHLPLYVTTSQEGVVLRRVDVSGLSRSFVDLASPDGGAPEGGTVDYPSCPQTEVAVVGLRATSLVRSEFAGIEGGHWTAVGPVDGELAFTYMPPQEAHWAPITDYLIGFGGWDVIVVFVALVLVVLLLVTPFRNALQNAIEHRFSAWFGSYTRSGRK